ncbi:MAG: hypothetical protein Kow0031_34050 [Anaerolineae bacterium]
MTPVSPQVLDQFWLDFDAREALLREVVAERLALNPPPKMDEAIVASYFFAFRHQTLPAAVAEISYHATSGIKNPPPGSLLEACSATAAGVDPFDAAGRIGLLHIAFPLKMLLHPDGSLTSTDILHTTASAVIFDMYENMDARLLHLEIPPAVLATFPGPAYGPHRLRQLTGFAPDQPAFGTILKPTAGITPDDVAFLVGQAAPNPLFMFIKEDENLYPNLNYSPVAERTRRAMAAIEAARPQRGGLGLIYAPHITGAPHQILDSVHAALEAGATGLMFSETFAGGAVRMVREATKTLPQPPALYGHNAGIGSRERAIWREVIDFLARLDGIDFRQTAPVKAGSPFIRPFGAAWEASERALSRPLPGINPAMITRAGGLDQGNIGLNLADAEQRGLTPNVLFLAGSAINSIKNEAGQADPRLGAAAMQEAVQVHRAGDLHHVPVAEYVTALKDVAARQGLSALQRALAQRYP